MNDNIVPFEQSNEPSMEKIEEICLSTLRQAQNPLVPVTMLLQRCNREKEIIELSEEVFVNFLRHHDLIELVDGPTPQEAITQGIFEQGGINMGLRAILKERIPNDNEMKLMMAEQMKIMLDTLNKAIGDAENEGDQDQKQQLEATLAKAKNIQLKLQELFTKS